MTGRYRALARCIDRGIEAREGVAAVEFAAILPALLIIVFGSYQLAEAASAYRKVTITARAVADLTTQYASMGSSDVSNVLNASAQVMVPFNTSGLSIVLTEYKTSVAGISTVVWSKALNATAATPGTIVALPANITAINSYIIYASVTYSFTPAIFYRLSGPINMTSQIFMSPRQAASVTYNGS